MSSNEAEPLSTQRPPPSPDGRRRRSSFAELFASRPNLGASGASPQQQQSAMSATLTHQAQEATRNRRLSITTLGLSGSPSHGQPATPFGSLKRGKSQSVTDSLPRKSTEERDSGCAIDESDAVAPGFTSNSENSRSPPARTVSFGARAYGHAKAPSLSGATNGSPGSEGFNWTENFRTRAERASISAAAAGPNAFISAAGGGHARSRSQATSEPVAAPVPPPPKPVQKSPDHFQERILKGDFYMD